MFVRSLALAATASLSLAFAAGAGGWGGYYIGLNAGQGSSETETTRALSSGVFLLTADALAVQSASVMSLDEETFAGGAQVGVNWPLSDHFLLGFEVDAQGFGNDLLGSATALYPLGGGLSSFTTTNNLEQAWFATARLRAGVTFGWFMIYATGGFAGADMKFTQTFADSFHPPETIENAEFRSGYSMGGGIEVMIESGSSLKIEYLHLDLGEITTAGGISVSGPIATPYTSAGRAETSDEILRVGFNFRMD